MTRRVTIVGNADLDEGEKALTGTADIVIRFNDCRSAGPSGGRTDIVAVCNTGRPGKRMLEDPAWRANPCVAAASEIWSIRDPAKFESLRAPLAISHPELDDFCDDYTDGFAAFCAASGKTHYVLPAATHDRLDAELSAYDPPPYVTPSTGLIVIAEFLASRARPGDAIMLMGFGHQGWEWHPWDAERQWIDARIREGYLTRYHDTSSLRIASGA
ncbi:Urease operon accessory protein [Rhizobium sp. G21]|uniref:Urease operon accessory protein n=1 Tax=Rhizobium sp. G21 TaxID=2758439 RepID=UPI001604609C|nr:Urease operon accessory protein [Rhizobium sp. G21]MBB1249994.1 Urease operon accessory protein [Rhizobium sp. G21]